MGRIMVTGSEGLVGGALRRALTARGWTVEPLDLRCADPSGRGDIGDFPALQARVAGCRGIVHLAAISRVVWGERDPEGCWQTNVAGTGNVIEAATRAHSRPWVLFASSREVYGEPATLPVGEDAELCPLNLYGRSKAAGEEIVRDARARGMRTAIVRLSNVYGRIDDHPDRVVPAFARAAALGAPMRVDGRSHTFDFVHVDDVARGLIALIDAIEDGAGDLPPVHLVTGRATTLGELAALANAAGGGKSAIVDAPERDYDVARFVGDPARAQAMLNWRARVEIAEGVRLLVREFRELAAEERLGEEPGAEDAAPEDLAMEELDADEAQAALAASGT